MEPLVLQRTLAEHCLQKKKKLQKQIVLCEPQPFRKNHFGTPISKIVLPEETLGTLMCATKCCRSRLVCFSRYSLLCCNVLGQWHQILRSKQTQQNDQKGLFWEVLWGCQRWWQRRECCTNSLTSSSKSRPLSVTDWSSSPVRCQVGQWGQEVRPHTFFLSD